jgi:hypothetical protein
MVRIRQGWLVAVFGLALALVAACNKDDKKAATAADKSGKAEAESPGLAAGKATADDLSLLPVDSEVVLGINFAQVQQSSLWKQFVEPKLLAGENQRKLTEFKEKCGFDPMASIKTASVGLKNTGGSKPDGTIVMHGVDKAKAWACLDKMKEEAAKEGAEITRDGDIGIVKNKNGDTSAFTFINDTTVLAVFGERATPDGIKAAAAGGSALKTSPAFVDMYSKVKTADSVWFLVNGKLLDKLSSMGVKANAVFGSLNVTDGLTLDMRWRLESPDAATQFATMAKSQAAQAQKMFDKLDVANDGNEVKFSVVLSNQKLQALITQVGGMLGAMGGMGTP